VRETGSCYVAQTSLELLGLSDPPVATSQVAGTTAGYHYAQFDSILKVNIGEFRLPISSFGSLKIMSFKKLFHLGFFFFFLVELDFKLRASH
jgi:hypothetical protein